jgi:fructose-1,6-bisphosphatase I
LDHDIGEFLLTHPDIRCPQQAPYYSANLANAGEWNDPTQAYIENLAGAAERTYSLRYSGALVADLHRSLIEGGIYLYPADQRYPEGKLRLLAAAMRSRCSNA